MLSGLQTEEPKMPKLSFGAAGREHKQFFCCLLFGFLALSSLAFAQTVQELRVQWTTSPPLAPKTSAERTGQPVAHLFLILDRQTMSGRLPRQREPELSSDRVVIIARESSGKILDWQVVADPRL